jgi:hypothetical protein
MKLILPLASAVALACAVGAHAADMTPPGSQLAVGQSAVLPLHLPYKGSIPAQVTVTAIDAGTLAEFQAAGFKVPPDAMDRKPYYVSYTVTALGDADLSGNSLGMLFGLDDRNEEHMETLTMSNFSGARFDRCKQGTFKNGDRNGSSYQSCKIFLVNANGAITGVRFKGGGDENQAYFQSPVVWRAGPAAPAPAAASGGTIVPGR